MKRYFILCLALFAMQGCGSSAFALNLATNGKTPYVIALADDAIPAEKTAAEQLQKYLLQITGAQFPIQSESAVNADVPQILVGAGARVKVLLPQQDWNSLGHDGIIIKTAGENLILAGGRPRGTLYAVFQFLEDCAGCRWWTPTENYIPRKSTFDVPKQNIVYVPPFNYREHFTIDVRENPVFATIMRENGQHQTQTEEWGGHYQILGWVHTYSQLLPPEKYFHDHPDWYSDPANGDKPCTAASKMPAAGNTQLCLSNPEVVDELSKQALAWIEKNPEAGYISISQNDNTHFCRDAASVKLVEEEGSQEAPILKFANEVAEKIHQRYPDFLVETLAYHGAEKPPKTIRPAKNVLIRLASSSADFGHPLNSDWNRETRDNVLEWSKIAPRLFVWNYITNFSASMLPHPNWTGLGADLKFFADNNVKGVFEQGDSYTNGVGDFVQLRTWLIAKLMWNPDLNQEQLTDKFLRGYYGAAAPYLQQYLELITQSFLSQHRPLSTVNTDYSFFTLDVTNKSIQLFDAAENAVKDQKVLLQRVRRERLSLDIMTLYRYRILQRAAAASGEKFLGPQNPQAAMQAFIIAAQKFGVRRWEQRQSFASRIPQLESMFAPPVPLPDFAQKYPAADVIDLQQGNFWLNRPGTLSDFIEDANASDGKAASIIGDTTAWAIQAQLNQFLDSANTNWHAYALARVDTTANADQKSIALRSGIYDVTNRKAIGESTFEVAQVAGDKYQKIDLETHPLNGGMYIWFAPAKNSGVTKIYVDRIILVRE